MNNKNKINIQFNAENNNVQGNINQIYNEKSWVTRLLIDIIGRDVYVFILSLLIGIVFGFFFCIPLIDHYFIATFFLNPGIIRDIIIFISFIIGSISGFYIFRFILVLLHNYMK